MCRRINCVRNISEGVSSPCSDAEHCVIIRKLPDIISNILWHICSKLRSQQKQPLLENGSANTPVTGEWFSSCHVIAATEMCATTELLEAVFSVW
jgi:hypothetical protein